MKIAMLTPDYAPDLYAGVGVHVTNLIEELAKIPEIEIEIFVLRCERLSSGIPKIYLDKNGYKVYEFGYKEDIVPRNEEDDKLHYFTYIWTHNNERAVEYIAKNIDINQYDIVHCHDMFPIWIMDYIKRNTDVPLVSTIHARSAGENKIEDALRGFLCRRTDKCIAVSKHLKDELKERYGNIDIDVVYNGVKPSNNVCSKKENYISYCGRLHKTKGVDILIKAFCELHKIDKYKNLKLKIIGEGIMKEELQDMSKTLGGDESIIFTGKMNNEDTRLEINRSLAHVIPSTYEPFATSALEAMEENTIVIASDVGGLSEMIHDYENGLLVPKGDPYALCNKLEWVIDNRDIVERIENNAKEDVKKYEWSNIAKEIVILYESILDMEKSLNESNYISGGKRY